MSRLLSSPGLLALLAAFALGTGVAAPQDGEKKSNDNFSGFVFQGNAYEGLTCDALEWIASAGGGHIIDNGKVTIDNKNARTILDAVRAQIGKITPKNVTTFQEDQTANGFVSGNAAFARNWPYMYSIAAGADSKVKGKFNVTVLPHGAKGGSVGTVGGWQLAVSKYSKHKAAAIEFGEPVVSERGAERGPPEHVGVGPRTIEHQVDEHPDRYTKPPPAHEPTPLRREHDESESGFQTDERGEATHGAGPRQRRKNVRAVHGGEDEDRHEDGELGEQQAAMRRPRQPRDALHLRDRVHHPRGHEDDHHEERGAGEATRGAHRVGAHQPLRIVQMQGRGEDHAGRRDDLLQRIEHPPAHFGIGIGVALEKEQISGLSAPQLGGADSAPRLRALSCYGLTLEGGPLFAYGTEHKAYEQPDRSQ